jgi:hypothetical protein
MPTLAKKPPLAPKSSRTGDIPWLARLTHPLVFFGAALAVFEGTIGTALLKGNHSDQTVIILCSLMAFVILAAIGTVAVLVVKKPRHLMLTTQDTIGEELADVRRVRSVARMMMASQPPNNPTELFELLDKAEKMLSSGEADE